MEAKVERFKHTDTRQKIVELGSELIQERGYNGFSYQDIASVLDIKKASIHYHFPTKEDLGIAVLAHYRKTIDEWIEAHHVAGMTPVERLTGYFLFFSETSVSCNKECPFGGLVADWNTLPEKLRQALEQFDNWHVDFVTALISEGHEAGVFHKRGDVKEQAMFLIASVQGAIHMAMERQSPEIYESITKQIKLCMVC